MSNTYSMPHMHVVQSVACNLILQKPINRIVQISSHNLLVAYLHVSVDNIIITQSAGQQKRHRQEILKSIIQLLYCF